MRRVGKICLVCVLALLVQGCTARNVTAGQAEGEHYDAVISVKGAAENGGMGESSTVQDGSREEEKDSVEALREESLQQLKSLTELVGKTDEVAAKMLGGGEQNLTADGGGLIGREYQALVFGQTCSVYTSYDEAGMVSMVLVQLEGTDAAVYEQQLESLFGTAEVLEDGEETRWRWEDSGYRYTLYAFSDAVCMDVEWAYGD